MRSAAAAMAVIFALMACSRTKQVQPRKRARPAEQVEHLVPADTLHRYWDPPPNYPDRPMGAPAVPRP